MMLFYLSRCKNTFFFRYIEKYMYFCHRKLYNSNTMKYTAFFVAAMAAMIFVGCGKDDAGQKSNPSDNNPSDNSPATDTAAVINPEDTATYDRIYQFKVLDGQGDSVSLADYRGQVLLVVNTATRCGYTPQYNDLERIYETYRDQGFTILDFPCNQFNGQAPGSYDDIHDYCTSTYNITFPQFDKIDVNGPNASPLYRWLKSKRSGMIPWNFTKFVINRRGEVVGRFDAQTSSMLDVQNAILNQL